MIKTKVQVDPSALFCSALVFLFVPLKWVFAALFSGVIHELGHVMAVYACKKRVLSIVIRPFGAKIDAGQMVGWQSIVCSLAGPAANLMLVFLSPLFPRIAICGGIQGLFNLLPVYPLDGGRILRCIFNTKV